MDGVERINNDSVSSGDASCSGNLELIYTDSNGSFASRRALKLFKSKNLKYGNAVCPECKQSFVNATSLERHLAVHQVFGAYLCPLCGKTFKYRYNLYFHWRRTCQSLNEFIDVEKRKEMDVNSLRLLVEEVVVKRSETETVDFGISSKALFSGNPLSKLEMPVDPQTDLGPLAPACSICGILVHKSRLPHHEALHSATTETGLQLLDLQSPTGAYFCDLCGVVFRNRDNLYTHWRSTCAEIMANIKPGSDLFLSDLELKTVVLDLLWRLRRVALQSPLQTNPRRSEYMDEMEPLMRSALDDDGGDSYRSSRKTVKRKGPSSSADPEGKALVFMNEYINPAETVVDIDGELGDVSVDRRKWNIPENGKPLQCPGCFSQFANAGRLERHISGFHPHYGAFKCLLCGHRFKYDCNLLFHYRHSCAYTKLLVGADVRELVRAHSNFFYSDDLDAASLRKLVSHIKQSDPQLRPMNSRLINIKRRPSLRAVPRNIRAVDTNMIKGKLKRHLGEGKKCPVCGVVFYGQKSLEKHIGTVHLANPNFLDKAIARSSQSPRLGCGAVEVKNKYSILGFLNGSAKLSTEQGSAEEDAPPLLEPEGLSEIPSVPIRCVDINGEEIHDFDAEQLSELDTMLRERQLSPGDLVITSIYGEDVEYRIAVGTRHGTRIVLERKKPYSALQNKEVTSTSPIVQDFGDDIPASVSSLQKKHLDNDLQKERTCEMHEESRNNEDVLEYVETGSSPQCADQGDTEVHYEPDQLEEYHMGDTEGHDRRRIVRVVDEGQDLLEYLDDEDCCDGFVQCNPSGEENGNRVLEFIESGTDMVHYLITENLNESEVVALLKYQTPSEAERQTCGSKLMISNTHKSAET